MGAISININNIRYHVTNLKEDATVYQFLETLNIRLPCFCYHDKLAIAGNCRMCLVEVNSKLGVSCALPISDNSSTITNIVTNSERIMHAREHVLEFLLVNHPLDCPVCDQGGECDLQDLSKTFGLDRGRNYSSKRSVDNLTCFGPFIKTIMTRCIHCTRCVRFLNDYCGIDKLGILGRGLTMEIGSYVKQLI